MIEVIEARRSLDDFISFPLKLYRNDPFYVPQLTRDLKEHFSAKNPFFRYAAPKYHIALRDGKPCGRIASFVNGRHNEYHNEKTGFFGFFECTRDPETAGALFAAAEGHLKAEGMERMRGPMSFSTNEECGFLIEGFEEPAVIMMPYNPPYYSVLSERCGVEKVMDLYAYTYSVADSLPEKVRRVAAIVGKKGITVRRISMKKFESEMMIFKDVYNSAWENNWGFIPLTDDELMYMAGRLKQIVVPELTAIAEKDGVPVGFLGIIPDFNVVLHRMMGRLNPLTVAKALYYSRKIQGARALLFGIKKEFRNKGVEALMFVNTFPAVQERYRRVEFSWILETNVAVQRTIELFGAYVYKKYRICEKPL